MKDELINHLTPKCLLPFTYMSLWLDNIILNNDPSGALRQAIKDGLRTGGQLTEDSWRLLVQNAQMEDSAAFNRIQAMNWITSQGCPTCAQFKLFIEGFKIGTLPYFRVMAPVFDLVEIDFYTQHREGYVAGRGGDKVVFHTPVGESQYTIEVYNMHLQIKNFNLIKDARPYLIIERYVGRRKLTRLPVADSYPSKKSGWRRGKYYTIGDTYHDGWSGQNVPVSFGDMFRPNNIELVSANQEIDFYPENYIKTMRGNRVFKPVNGKMNRVNTDGAKEYYNIQVPLRFRIAYKMGNEEIISKPLLYFTIFARVNKTEKTVQISYSKL